MTTRLRLLAPCDSTFITVTDAFDQHWLWREDNMLRRKSAYCENWQGKVIKFDECAAKMISRYSLSLPSLPHKMVNVD